MMNQQRRYQDYIQFLRENFGNLVRYKEITGTMEPSLARVKKDLFDEDPFVVFGASLIATAAFAEKNLYH